MEAKTIVLIVGGAVTVAAAGMGTYFGLKARAAREDADDLVAQAHKEFGMNACAPSGGASDEFCNRISDKNHDRRDAARIANISFAVSGVAAVATGVTYLLWPRAKSSSSTALLVPIVAPHVGGISFQGGF
ncbi:MAG: hypothetical protein QM784_30310 [Polyangiaceae bacterium]